MGAVYFYHLTSSPLEVALGLLIGRARGAGWRVAVRGRDAERMAWLDARLWLGTDDGFVPHGIAGGPHDARQPVLLTTAGDCPNGAECLMVVDRAEPEPGELARFERVCVIFEGGDAEAVEAARALWRREVEAGASAQYWAEGAGGWEKRAER